MCLGAQCCDSWRHDCWVWSRILLWRGSVLYLHCGWPLLLQAVGSMLALQCLLRHPSPEPPPVVVKRERKKWGAVKPPNISVHAAWRVGPSVVGCACSVSLV